MNASVPIVASGIIPVAQSDVANIPSIALSIPDFEGQAILRIFANSTQSQIGCYSAVVTNGVTFSQPAAVGTVLGIFTVIALVSSAAVAMYGNHIPTTRKHYAHSISVFVVFSIFHHIYFTGALSMNWPSVLVSFWSNYAWSAGMIYTSSMQNSINQLIGSNRGNISMVGSAASGVNANNLGGGYQLSQIYKRGLDRMASIFQIGQTLGEPLRPRRIEHTLAGRDLANTSSGFAWYGQPVAPGLPLPGNFSGLAGTLGAESIPASNAFLTGFLWFLILVAAVALGIFLLKWLIEGLSRMRMVKSERLAFFREHYLGFMGAAVLRTMFIAFFMFMFLTMFQFTLGGSKGVIAIAGVVFAIFFAGMFGIAGYALYYRLRHGSYASNTDRINVEKKTKLGFVPWYGFTRASKAAEDEDKKVYAGSVPSWRIRFIDQDAERPSIHDDEDYIKKFGWLASRFRRTRWWFFAAWLVYEFVRACFYGGAAGHPMTQVFGLLVVEIIGWVAMWHFRPFEGQRLNVFMVWALGFSKVTTVALSAAFDIRFNLGRITTTAIGIVIIVIQGLLTILLMIAIVTGAMTSWMSIHRNREECKPKSWTKLRAKYFAHVEQRATDLPKPPAPPPEVHEEPKEPYFNVGSVKRIAKIEDEDADAGEQENSRTGSKSSIGVLEERKGSLTASVRSQISYQNLPFGARPHRASWSSRDFSTWHDNNTGPLVRMSDTSLRETAMRQRAHSRANSLAGGHSRTNSLANPPRAGTPGAERSLEVKKHRNQRSNGGTPTPFDENKEADLKEVEL